MKKTIEKQAISTISIIKGMIIFLIIIMSLIHVYFGNKPDGTRENYLEYKSIIQERDSVQNILLLQLSNSIINKEQYIEKSNIKSELYSNKIKACNKEKRAIINSFKFNGRKSFHYWLFIFGLSFSFFFLAIRYTYRIIYDHKNTHLKKSLFFEASAWMAVSLFWVIHSVFVKSADLPTFVYASIMLCVCLLISISIFFFIKYLIHRKTHTLESYKASIVRLIELIADIKVDHYFKMAVKASTEENEAEINKDAEVLDKKIFSTLDSITDEKK
ncbi:hypothetical protein H2O64_04505 [Kordia sp. YSTF-M3]|uniref:Uncharacterized protein n=1 Tax=Kordia aestuariivivens TaxID=2759037 RepID=A0ABR7Q6G3_9FLAO|nr:hypothetical protein [Kordia aestuariivivens]MBC8753919.1 hypothetical protein [Kordia aestuariivivens]